MDLIQFTAIGSMPIKDKPRLGAGMRVLVTGGAGFIGSHLVDGLVQRGDEVVVFDNMSSGRESFLAHHRTSDNPIQFVNSDLLDLEAVRTSMEGVDMVFHLAANPDIRLGTRVTDTDLKQGTIATYNVLEAMRLEGVTDIAFSSSSVVYGEAEVMPTPENYGPLLPISLYGASKLASEALITSWVGTFGLRAWLFRFANIVGARGTHGVIYDFIHKLKANPRTLEVLGDGKQEKAYMEVIDCARAMLHLTKVASDSVNLFNLGTGDTCSVSMIAAIVIEESGLQDVEIQYTGGDRGWAGVVPRTYLAVDRLFSTGFSPMFDSESAIRHTAQCLIEEIGLDHGE